MAREAMFYKRSGDGKVDCMLCPHNCRILPGQTGVCRARKNTDGKLYTLNYGKVTSAALDPIEKKPLKKYRPGSYILSAGTFGCNLRCPFCQNWTIAHEEPGTVDMTPAGLVQKAQELKGRGNIGIAYTYNEPFIWYEFVCETCREARQKDLVNVLVTNGFVSMEPLKQLMPYIDAMNIDVKAFTPGFYRNVCKASLENVMETVEYAAQHCHVEVTTLIIPGLNDSDSDMDRQAQWLSSISPEITLHLSRYFPNYNMTDRPPTAPDTLKRLKEIAQKRLRHVFLGNI